MRPSGGFVGNELAACLRSARTPLVDPFSVQLQQPWDCVRWMRKLLLLWRCLFRCFHIFVICWAGCIYLWCFGDYPFLSVIIQKMDIRIFPSWWERATPRERNYLGDDPLSVGISRGRRRSPRRWDRLPREQVRYAIQRLNVVWSPERGRIAFTVPGMVDFIRRQQLD